MEIDKKEFKKKYPKIAEEMERTNNTIRVNFNKTNSDSKKIRKEKDLKGFNPTVIDFIRRCNTVQEAESIINYLEKRGEISTTNTENLRIQLKEKGIRSFGPKKGDNYYIKKYK
jgi:hypothetical protein